MKQFNDFYFIVILSLVTLTVNAQWTPSFTGNNSGITHCFIEIPGGILSGGNGLGIYLSMNNGNNWIASNTGIVSGSEILCFGKNSAGIFAGSDSLIYFSSDNGTSWTIVNNSKNVFGLAFMTDTVFGATIGNGIIMSPNNGLTWFSLNNGLPNNSVYSILAKGNKLYAGTFNGVYVSSNSGSSWTSINNGLPSSIIIRCLETDGVNIYAGTTSLSSQSNGMYISSNNGTSWVQVTSGISPISFVMGITNVGNVMFAGAGMAGVYRSLNNGQSWYNYNIGLPILGTFGAGNFYETTSFVFCGIEHGGGSIYKINKDSIYNDIALESELTDIDGNIYNTRIIGSQVWMQENLKVTRYCDGTIIPNISNTTTWLGLSSGARCYYNNDSINDVNVNGALYNWYAVVDTHHICPVGWQIPSYYDWYILEYYLQSNGFNYDGTTSGNKYGKSLASTTSWNTSSVTGAVGNTDYSGIRNITGFTGLPSGWRTDGFYGFRSSAGFWWSSYEYSSTQAMAPSLFYSTVDLMHIMSDKTDGNSVRCIKNQSSGINELDKPDEYNIFPNPAHNFISIGGLQNSLIEIINIQGQILLTYKNSNSNNNFDISRIPNGIYILKITSNNKVSIKKLIKQ